MTKSTKVTAVAVAANRSEAAAAVNAVVNRWGWIVTGSNKSGTQVYVSPTTTFAKQAKAKQKTLLDSLAKWLYGQCANDDDWQYVRSTLRAVAAGDAAAAIAAHDAHCTHNGTGDNDVSRKRFTAPFAATWKRIRDTKRDTVFVAGFVAGTQPGSAPQQVKSEFDW